MYMQSPFVTNRPGRAASLVGDFGSVDRICLKVGEIERTEQTVERFRWQLPAFGYCLRLRYVLSAGEHYTFSQKAHRTTSCSGTRRLCSVSYNKVSLLFPFFTGWRPSIFFLHY